MPLIQRIPNNFSTSFSNAVVVTMGEYSTIYISGQVGYVVGGGPVKVTAESFEEEAMICYFNIDRSLQEVGATLKDIVRITAYLTDAKDYPVYDKVRQETFAGAPPSSSTVIVAGLLANARLEVDAIAVIKKRRPRFTRAGFPLGSPEDIDSSPSPRAGKNQPGSAG
jgi:2-iminobutanoate/2-iminopropanoate deaminase